MDALTLHIEAKIAEVEETYADVLNMSAEAIANHEYVTYWHSKRTRAIGLIDAYNSVLERETDNSKYPCMTAWREAMAAAGIWPWSEGKTA